MLSSLRFRVLSTQRAQLFFLRAVPRANLFLNSKCRFGHSSNISRCLSTCSTNKSAPTCRSLSTIHVPDSAVKSSSQITSATATTTLGSPLSINDEEEDTKKLLDKLMFGMVHGMNGNRYRLFIRSLIKEVSDNPEIITQAKSKYIEEKMWKVHAFNFRRKLAKSPDAVFQGAVLLKFLGMVDDLLNPGEQINLSARAHVASVEQMESNREELQALILSKMLSQAEVDLREEIASNFTLLRCSDLRLPHEWYPHARLMKRKIIFHGGPTNSGV